MAHRIATQMTTHQTNPIDLPKLLVPVLSLRNGFTAYSALSPVIGFLATVIGGTYRQLDASTEASGPHVFAVRFRAVRQRRIRVHRSLSHVRDDGRRPSWRDRMAIDVPLICPAAKAKYF